MSYTVTDIEVEIINAINADATMSGYLKTVRTYQGDLEEALNDIIIRFPFALVVFNKSIYDRGGYPSGVFDQTMEFSILVGDNNLRGEEERRRGVGGGKPGTYKMLADLRSILGGNKLGLDIRPLEPVFEESLAQGKNISVYEAIYRTAMDYDTIT